MGRGNQIEAFDHPHIIRILKNKGKRLTFECNADQSPYQLLQNPIPDSLDHADALARLLKGMDCRGDG